MTRLAVSSFLVAAARLSAAAAADAHADVPAAAEAKPTEATLVVPRRDSAPEHLYASVVTAAPDATEYLLACAPDFKSPYPADCGDFTGVTLTQGPSTMRLEIGEDTYQCDLSESQTVCDIQAGAELRAATTLSEDEAAAWLVTVTMAPSSDAQGDTDEEAKERLDLRKRQNDGNDDATTAESSASSTDSASSSSTTSTGNPRCPSQNNEKRSPQRGSGSGNIGNNNCNNDNAAGSVRAQLWTVGTALASVMGFVAFAL